MFKRKSTPPTVSPLAPPQPQQGNHRHSQQMNGHSLPRTASGSASGSQQGHPQQGQGLVAGPAYGSGGPVDRVGSYDSSTMKSEKSDRRRSGLFGFGKKDKDKDKDKAQAHRVDDRDKDLPQPRPSFSVDRNQANHQLETSALTPASGRPGQPQPQAQAQYQPGTAGQQRFQPYPMHQFPPPRPGQTPPSPVDGPLSPVAVGRPQSQQFGQSPHPRIASNPQSPPTIASNDFGPYPSASQLPRSQTMGFSGSASGSGPDRTGSGSAGAGQIPETHPYRGFLNGQQDQDGRPRPQSQSQMPRSGSMPLDKPQPLPPSMSNGNSPQPSPNTSSTFPPQESPSEQSQPKRNSFSPRASQPTSRQTSQSNNMPTPQTIQQPPIPSGLPQRDQPNWQREFNTVVDLIAAQPNKHYVASPPELEMILARTSAGALPKQGQPGSATNDWDAVWLQLSGISLSMWSMKETRAAAAKGEKVPPTYFNITDSSLELLAPLPPPPHRPNSHAHHFVFSLNTAGSNRLLFSCPSERDLARWATGLRLAAWERARLEEIYTGHLIKTGGREPKMELVKGRMEGWVRVRVMGGTDWKRLWLVLSAPYNEEPSKEEEKKSRRRSIFGFGDKPQPEPVQEPNTGENMASFYTEPRTQKNRTTPAVLTITNITQSYAVFPERLEVMSQSNLMKVVGRVNGELVTIEGRLRDSGWALIMPEASEEVAASAQPTSPLANMMRWVTAFHDVFGLYGRPERYIWDRTNPKSFFFAYPEGPDRNNLFLDTDDALLADFRTASLPAIRASFVANVQRKMLEPAAAAEYRDEKAGLAGGTNPAPRPDGDYRLPPLTFDRPSPNMSSESQPRSLTPITERTDDASRQNSTRTTNSSVPFDRRPSDGVSKQDSGSSARKVSGGDDQARLAPITDEGPGHWTEDPKEILSPQDSDGPPLPTPVTQTTLDSQAQTSETQWSQESADQSGASTPTTTHPRPSGLAPLVISPQEERGEQSKQADRLPDVSTAKPNTTTVPAVPAAPLAEPIPAPIPTAVVPAAASSSTVVPVVTRPVSPPRAADLQVQAPTPRKVSSPSQEPISPTRAMLQEEPAAMYLMNMVDEPQQSTVASTSPNQQRNQLDREKEERMRSPSDTSSSALPTIGRKPSGARAPPPKKASTGVTRTLVPVDESAASPVSPPATTTTGPSANHVQELSSSTTQHDLGEDASAYMAYAEQSSPEKGKSKENLPPTQPIEEEKNEPRSSFVLSKTAAERRARAEAAAAEQERAMYVPGGGKRTGPARDHTWSDSDEDEDDEDDGSPEVQTRTKLPPVPQIRQQQQQSDEDPSSLDRSTSRARALPIIPPRVGANGSMDDYRRPSPIDQENAARSRPHSRSPQPTMHEQQYRHPQYHGQQQAHPRSQYDPQYNRQSQAPPAPAQQPQTTRQSVWNANFAAEHGMPENKSGKFIELEDPSTQLTKAFSPHGLLQAGLQDKEDRSAKRQEQLARETGSSLINVPAKPPPPQTGLLGAVAAHERERKNAGGIGATLTDREREKRLNEDRQRELERNNRGSQMDPIRQYGGDPYGGQQQYPYGMPPMMMGMPPGMPPMPYGQGYQGGYNPYAQQQAMMAAQMAYQQAMMSMSQHGGGGSQTGHGTPDRSSSPASQHLQHQQHLAPPGAGGGFGGYYPPPHMSPYGWPGMMWGGGSPAPGSPMGPPPPVPGQSPGVQAPSGQGWFPPPPHIQHDGAPRSRGPSMYSDDGGRGQGQGQGQGEDRDRSRDRDRGPVN